MLLIFNFIIINVCTREAHAQTGHEKQTSTECTHTHTHTHTLSLTNTPFSATVHSPIIPDWLGLGCSVTTATVSCADMFGQRHEDPFSLKQYSEWFVLIYRTCCRRSKERGINIGRGRASERTSETQDILLNKQYMFPSRGILDYTRWNNAY